MEPWQGGVGGPGEAGQGQAVHKCFTVDTMASRVQMGFEDHTKVVLIQLEWQLCALHDFYGFYIYIYCLKLYIIYCLLFLN